MKLVKSECGKAWLFDVAERDGWVTAGLACFLPACSEKIVLDIKGTHSEVFVPEKVIDSPVPVKVVNARLSLLISTPHE